MNAVKGQRWTAEIAGAEFGIDRSTLSSRLKRNGAVAGDDGMFATRQIADAVYGSYEIERTRKIAAEADILESERARIRKEVIPVAPVLRLIANRDMAVVRIIRTTELSSERQDEIYKLIENAVTADDILDHEDDAEGDTQIGGTELQAAC